MSDGVRYCQIDGTDERSAVTDRCLECRRKATRRWRENKGGRMAVKRTINIMLGNEVFELNVSVRKI